MSSREKRSVRDRVVVAAVAVLFLLWPTSGYTMELAAPFSLETSQVLPAGVRSPQIFGITTLQDRRFLPEKGTGTQPLGFRANQPVGWADVMASQEGAEQKELVKSILHGKPAIPGHNAEVELPFGGSAGRATGIVNLRANVQVPVLAWGVTDAWTVAVAVPIVKAQAAVDTGFQTSADGQAFIDRICTLSPDKCNDSARRLNDASNDKLKRLGYLRMQSETVSGVGDVQLVSKHLLLHDEQSGLAMKGVLTLPTGNVANPDDVLNLGTGEGRFQLGAEVIYDHSLYRELGANLYAGYTALLPNHMVKHLPASTSDSLSADKEELTRELGHLVSAGAAVDYKWDQAGLIFSAGYNFQSLSRAQYSGSANDSATRSRYYLLGDLEPDELLHSLVTTIGFSTVDWYLKKKFFLPFQLNVAYSHPFAGRNAPAGDIWAGQAVLFF